MREQIKRAIEELKKSIYQPQEQGDSANKTVINVGRVFDKIDKWYTKLQSELDRQENKPLTLCELKTISDWVWLEYKNYVGNVEVVPISIWEIYKSGRIEVMSNIVNSIYYDENGNFLCNGERCTLYKHRPS